MKLIGLFLEAVDWRLWKRNYVLILVNAPETHP